MTEDKKNEAIESPETSGDADQSNSNVYEVGFHIVPTIAEENLSEETDFIRNTITKAGGEIISEGNPYRMDLAYEIAKEISGDRKVFNQSYFGWVKFEIESEKIQSVKKALELREPILRHLIIKTIREDTFIPREKRKEALEIADDDTSDDIEEKKELTDEDKKAIDESIEEMVSDDSEDKD